MNDLNRTGFSMVVPGTTREKRYPGRVMAPSSVGGLPQDTWFMCDQLRTVDQKRLRRRIGTVELELLRQVLTHTTAFLRMPDE